MKNIVPHLWSQVKEVKFHHHVKRFYYKNLFRKIYTIAIIGLIGANIFSMIKYASFADESLVNETSTQEQGGVATMTGSVDGHPNIEGEDSKIPSTGAEANTGFSSNDFTELSGTGQTSLHSEGQTGSEVDSSSTTQNDEDSIEGQGNVISNECEKSSERDETCMDSSSQAPQNDDIDAQNDENFIPLDKGDMALAEGIGDTQDSSADISESQTLTKEQELANARETLNTAPISKSYEHNKVRVNVKAPVGSFPEKAELIIKPIDRGNVNKVAFDISFIYTYADGSTVELQPKDGTKVQVSFNYEKNEDWLNGMNNGGKLKVTHTHDGNKENVDVTDEEEGSLSFDMDKFSIVGVELLRGSSTAATLLPGQEFNVKLKKLAGNSSASYNLSNSNIKSVIRTGAQIEGLTENNIISTSDSEYPIYAWFDSSEGIIYYYTEAETIYMNVDSSYMFSYFARLGNLDLSSWDTSNVTSFNDMFYSASINSGLDLSNWEINSGASLSNMFSHASINSGLDLSNWKLNSGASLSNMFNSASINSGLDLSSWDTSNVTSFAYMFSSASINSGLDLSNWEINSGANLSNMFNFASINSGLDLSSWEINSGANLSNMFNFARINSGLDLSSWEINSGASLSNMFNFASINSGLDLSNWEINSGANLSNMFNYASINSGLDLSSWDTSNVTSFAYMFSSASINSGLDLSSWEINSGANLYNMFSNASINSELDLSNWEINSGANLYNMFYYASINSGLDLSNWEINSGASLSNMFYYASINAELDLSSWDTSNVTSLSNMFSDASINSELDLSNWEINSGANLYNMFSDASINSELDLSSWEINSGASLNYMFSNARINSELDLSSWDTSNVTSFAYMFSRATINSGLDLSSWKINSGASLSNMFSRARINSELDLSSWDTSNVTSFAYMFNYASINSGLDLSNWDTSNVTDMSYMFSNASINSELDLSNWEINSGASFAYMFNYATITGTLYFGNLYNAIYVNNMFSYSHIKTIYVFKNNRISGDRRGAFSQSEVVGGNGTTCKGQPDTSYWRIDGDGGPGCFTEMTGYTLRFDSQGGSTVNPKIVTEGYKWKKPVTNPTKDGVIFDGWYTSSTYNTLFDFNLPATQDKIAYAKRNTCPSGMMALDNECVPQYTVTFDSNGGSEIEPQNLPEGTKVTKPDNPTTGGAAIFKGRYIDEELENEFDFETQITFNITLYAKWEICPDGYVVGKTMCVPMSSNDGNGYIELTYGDETVYIKDRNQGASVSAQKIIEINNLKNEYNMCSSVIEEKGIVGGTKGTNNRKSGSQDGDFFGEVSDIIGAEVTTCEEIDEYIDEVMPLSYGDYYYRGNNTGASRDELGVDTSNPRSMRADVSQKAIDRGFDGGHLGEPEGKGWIEGNIQANPCDPEEGEYLPTVDDWKKAMEIWYETKGYNLNIDDYDDYGYIYYDSEFMNDILVPNAGYIKYDYELVAYNQQDDTNKMNLLALLFANPVMAEYQGYWQYISYIQNGYPYLWSAVDSGHKFGSFDEGDNRYNYRNIDINEYDFDINAKAAPVRCFIDPDYVNGMEKYTVTFDTKGGNEAVPAQTVKEGKELKEPSIPTRDNYTFDGWYTSNGTKWIFDTDTVQSEMTLYAKWRLCGEGFVVENNKCIPEGMELNGVIKVTGELGTMYIRDRNVGVTSDAAVNLLKLNKIDIELDNQCDNQCYGKNDYDKCYNECYGSGFSKKIKEELGTSYENIDDAYNSLRLEVLEGVLSEKEMEALKFLLKFDEANNLCENKYDIESCVNNFMITYINERFNQNFETVDELEEWSIEYLGGEEKLEEFHDKYNNGYYQALAYQQANGNYYYRGNNSGVNYNDIKFEDPDDWTNVTNMEELIERGFTEGKIGIEGQGWIDGNPNPCDPEKGEYLPTPEDWIDIMEIWGNSKGYHMESDNNEGINSIGIFDDDGYNIWFEFGSDILVPQAGRISGGRFVRASNLWSAENDGDNLGYYHDGSFYYGNKSVSEEIGGNTYAMPVRCFVNPAEIPDVYVVSYETNGGDNDIPDVNVIAGDTVILPTPTKANYTFGGWYSDKSLTHKFTSSDIVTSDLTLYAKWTTQQPSTPTNGYSGGGGGGKVTKPDTNKNDHGSAETPKSEVTAPIEGGEKNESSDGTKGSTFSKPVGAGSDNVVLDMESYNPSYSFEQNQAYQFAKSYGITTKPAIQDANVNGNLTRIQMAKMLSQYAVNILGKEPDLTNGTVKFADVPQSLDKKYDNGVSVAYLLGIMGQNMKDNRFRPYDEVTRGEFVTAFSRMIYNTSDGKYKSTPEYYTNHINKLSLEQIITKIDPKMKELRGYVMLMLYRSVK